MRSLRAQVIVLVAGAVLGSVALLSAFGVRSATLQFRASIQERSGLTAPRETQLEPARALARDSGLAALTRRIASGDTQWLEGPVLLMQPGGQVLAVSDSAFEGAVATRMGERGASIEVRRQGELRRLILDGGAWMFDGRGDTLGLLIPLPAVKVAGEMQVSVDSASRAFGAGFNRRLWFGAAGILAVAVLVATWLTGRLLDPLTRVRAAAARIADGDYAARVGPAGLAEIDPVAATFDRMAESLQRSEASRRQLMRNVAHELRTPLTILRAQVESLQDGLRPADAAAMASLHEEIAMLERLVGDVDVLARAQAGRLELDRDDVDLAPLVDRAAHAFVAAGRLPATALQVDAASVIASVDASRVSQVVRNLIDNAVQHGGPGVQVRVTLCGDGEAARLRVSDTGPGIPAADQPFVFDHLYRADPSRARSRGGSGLGLSIVRAIAEAHGGTARLVAAGAPGARVEVTLPIRGPSAAPR